MGNKNIAAGIDLGSNSFRILIAEVSNDTIVPLASDMATVQLGRGVAQGKRLRSASISRAILTLRSFRVLLDKFSPKFLRICGTEALRRARNSSEFTLLAGETLGTDVEIISAHEEAELTLQGIRACSKNPLPIDYCVADVGGSSTEILLAKKDRAEHIITLPIGAVGLTERFLSPAPITITEKDRLFSFLKKTLGNALSGLISSLNSKDFIMLASGGTITSLAALNLNLSQYNSALVHGHRLQESDLYGLWNHLAQLSGLERNHIPGLEEGRGEILPAGLAILLVLLQVMAKKEYRVSDAGLLEGILLSGILRYDMFEARS